MKNEIHNQSAIEHQRAAEQSSLSSAINPIDLLKDGSALSKSSTDHAQSNSDAAAAKMLDGFAIGRTDGRLIAEVNDTQMAKLSNAFNVELDKMRAEGHHQDGLGWAQNTDESRKCYSQAIEMGEFLQKYIKNRPDMSGHLKVNMGTINEGKGANPIDFYTGHGEHNFLVITDTRDNSKIYADPWKGINFTRNAHDVSGGARIKIKDLQD